MFASITKAFNLAFWFFLVTFPAHSWGFQFMGSKRIEIQLAAVDEEGKRLPYVTVWGALQPQKNPLALSGSDLWRLATRYGESFELVSPVYKITPCLIVYPMGDAEGNVSIDFDYEYHEGKGHTRPEHMQLAFVLLKKGYFPSKVEFDVKMENKLRADVVMRRDFSTPLTLASYERDFERLRHELSDTSSNVVMTKDNGDRLQRLRREMTEAAEEAEKNGDNSAAAKIFARMQNMPSIRYINGVPSGYAQSDPYSEASWKNLERAHRLDENNKFIRAEYLFYKASLEFGGGQYKKNTASVERKLAFSKMLAQLDAFMDLHGKAVWPVYRSRYARWFQRSEFPEKTRVLLNELYKDEPKFETYENLMKYVTP